MLCLLVNSALMPGTEMTFLGFWRLSSLFTVLFYSSNLFSSIEEKQPDGDPCLKVWQPKRHMEKTERVVCLLFITIKSFSYVLKKKWVFFRNYIIEEILVGLIILCWTGYSMLVSGITEGDEWGILKAGIKWQTKKDRMNVIDEVIQNVA